MWLSLTSAPNMPSHFSSLSVGWICLFSNYLSYATYDVIWLFQNTSQYFKVMFILTENIQNPFIGIHVMPLFVVYCVISVWIEEWALVSKFRLPCRAWIGDKGETGGQGPMISGILHLQAFSPSPRKYPTQNIQVTMNPETKYWRNNLYIHSRSQTSLSLKDHRNSLAAIWTWVVNKTLVFNDSPRESILELLVY